MYGLTPIPTSNPDGSLRAKTHEEMVGNTMNALGDMGDQLVPVATACDVVAVASVAIPAAVMAAPAVVAGAQYTTASAQTGYAVAVANGSKTVPVLNAAAHIILQTTSQGQNGSSPIPAPVAPPPIIQTIEKVIK